MLKFFNLFAKGCRADSRTQAFGGLQKALAEYKLDFLELCQELPYGYTPREYFRKYGYKLENEIVEKKTAGVQAKLLGEKQRQAKYEAYRKDQYRTLLVRNIGELEQLKDALGEVKKHGDSQSLLIDEARYQAKFDETFQMVCHARAYCPLGTVGSDPLFLKGFGLGLA